jgi:hypothetical protein
MRAQEGRLQSFYANKNRRKTADFAFARCLTEERFGARFWRDVALRRSLDML